MMKDKHSQDEMSARIEQLEKELAQYADMEQAFRKSENELEKSRETLERAQAIAHVGSWDWDIVSGSLHWTDEIYRIFGLTPQQFGATYEAFLEYIHPDDREAVIEAVNQAVGDEKQDYSIEHRVVRPDGSERIVNERGKVYRDKKKTPLRMIGTVQDITEKKHAEEKIRKLNEELEERVEKRTTELKTANEELTVSLKKLSETQDQLVQSEKMASLGGLVAGVAHEINTPVGVSVTALSHLQMKLEEYAERYSSGQLTRNDFEALLNSARESSHIVHVNLNRAVELISSFKQVAVDQTSNEVRQFHLQEYLHEIMHSLTPKLKKGDHQVSIDCPVNIVVQSHPGALSQVITNLVMNSLIHGFEDMTEGQIRITVSEPDKGLLRLEYMDNGKGMRQESVEKIFEPFFTTRRGSGGSGLGMHIVYNLVTQTLGGKIECSSIEGECTAFRIEFPSDLAQQDQGKARSA